MKTFSVLLLLLLSGTSVSTYAQTSSKAKNDTLTLMIELSRPNNNHQILEALSGNWQFQDARLSFVKGTLTRKPVYDGRFYEVNITGGVLQVPVADGKMKSDNYKSMQLEGYDNGQKLYVTTSVNNHIGSDIQFQTGTYDASSHSFTYYWESELLPGNKVYNKRNLKVVDATHYTEEYFEKRNGTFVKVRELDYTKAD